MLHRDSLATIAPIGEPHCINELILVGWITTKTIINLAKVLVNNLSIIIELEIGYLSVEAGVTLDIWGVSV